MLLAKMVKKTNIWNKTSPFTPFNNQTDISVRFLKTTVDGQFGLN